VAAPPPETHTVGSWLYDVSEQVASFSITGFIAFVFAKKLKLGRLAEVSWQPVITQGMGFVLTIAAVLGLIAVGAIPNVSGPAAYVGVGVGALGLVVALLVSWYRQQPPG
jgi:hypothetical protein